MFNNINWNLLFTAIATIVILLTAIVITYQVWLQKKINQLQTQNYQLEAFMKVLEEINSQETRKARNAVFRLSDKLMVLYQSLGPENIPEDVYENMQKVWNSYNHIGYMVNQGMVKEEFVIDVYSGAIIRSWVKLFPIIMNIRKVRGKEFSRYFEELYIKSKNYKNQK